MKPIAILANQIYRVDNDKVIDNEINKIEVPQREVVPENKFADTIYSNNFNIEEDSNPQTGNSKDHKDFNFLEYPTNKKAYGRIATAVKTEAYYNTVNISIPKVKDNKRITKVYNQIYRPNNETEEVKNGIQISVKSYSDTYEDVSIGYNPSTDTFSWKEPSVTPTEKSIFDITDIKFEKTVTFFEAERDMGTTFAIDKLDYNLILAKSSLTTVNDSNQITAYSGYNIETIGNDFTFTEDDKYFYISNLKIATQVNVYLGYAALYSNSDLSTMGEVGSPNIKGLYVKTIPESIEITIKGDSYGISLNEIIQSLGSGDKVVSFSGNELMQTTNNVSVSDMYNKVIEKYANGKETAVLRCAIGDYKYINSRTLAPNGWLRNISYSGMAISTSDSTLPMTFRIGDIVEPYVYNWRNGQNVDYPLSIVNKEPKKFQVVGVNISSDGSIFQDITLIEYEEKAVIQISGVTPMTDEICQFTLISGSIKVGDIIVTDDFYGQVKRADTTYAIKVNDISKVNNSKTYECYLV